MAGLAAGSLDRRVRIERATPSDNGLNTTEAWSELATIWARYIPARGQEAREQMGQEGRLLATFQLRWSAKVSVVVEAGFRLRFPVEGQVWDIKSAIEIGRREGIEIVAEARRGVVA